MGGEAASGGRMNSVDLEEKVAHLIRAVEDLSDVVARQASEIAGLERRVRLLMERAAEEEALGGAPEANVRPPHW
ncbi:MAG: SlyX family protein [Tabrizicola sp.]